MWTTIGLLAALSASHASDTQPWRLVAAYDASTISRLEVDLDALLGGAEDDTAFLWRTQPGMEDSCGPAKRPDGLGIFEAEAIASGLSPTLMLVLEGPPDAAPLTTRDVRISMGRDGARVLLQPMVEPRYLALRFQQGVDGHEARWRKLLQTQLAVEACLEHKVGRGWLGADEEQLREAYLLDPPPFDQPSRRFFGGQAEPVPALRGSPDACLDAPLEDFGAELGASRGAGAFGLQPSDVWGASLRPCPRRLERPDDTTVLPLALPEGFEARPEPPTWQSVHIDFKVPDALRAAERRVLDAAVGVRVGPPEGAPWYDGPLMEPLTDSDDLGLIDVLARVPYVYPRLITEDGRHAYTVLALPDWQLVEALRRLDRHITDPSTGGVEAPMATDPDDIVDGVGTVLRHPELVFVQLRGQDDEAWPNLASVLRGRVTQGPWGYTVDARAARSPIALPGSKPPTWLQRAQAQQATLQAVLYLSTSIVGLAFLLGLRRLRDLWSTAPTERASYWPGVGEVVVSEAPTTGQVDDGPPGGGG